MSELTPQTEITDPKELAISPETEAKMSPVIEKLKKRNLELDGRMLTVFGEGQEALLVLTQPLKFSGREDGKSDFLAITLDGYKRIRLSPDNRAEGQYGRTNETIRERRNQAPGTGEGYIVGKGGRFIDMTTGEYGGTITTIKPPFKYWRALKFKDMNVGQDNPFRMFPLRYEDVTDEGFVKDKINIAQEVAKTEIQVEKQRLEFEEQSKKDRSAAEEQSKKDAESKTKEDVEASNRVRDAINNQLDDLLR